MVWGMGHGFARLGRGVGGALTEIKLMAGFSCENVGAQKHRGWMIHDHWATVIDLS
jgi:hypothetical protein